MAAMTPIIQDEPGEGPHILENTWCFWEHRSSDKKTMNKQYWANLQKKLCDFNTVEDFWQYFSHIPPPSEVRAARTLHSAFAPKNTCSRKERGSRCMPLLGL